MILSADTIWKLLAVVRERQPLAGIADELDPVDAAPRGFPPCEREFILLQVHAGRRGRVLAQGERQPARAAAEIEHATADPLAIE